jgi:hypothetical protein
MTLFCRFNLLASDDVFGGHSMKKNAAFLAAAAAILLALFFLSSGKKAPLIPADGLHQNVTTNAACGECHAPGKRAPLKATHPPKEQCLICHKAAR